MDDVLLMGIVQGLADVGKYRDGFLYGKGLIGLPINTILQGAAGCIFHDDKGQAFVHACIENRQDMGVRERV